MSTFARNDVNVVNIDPLLTRTACLTQPECGMADAHFGCPCYVDAGIFWAPWLPRWLADGWLRGVSGMHPVAGSPTS